MTELVIFLLLVVAVVAATLRYVRTDGYGRRQPPRSHPEDVFSPTRFA